MLYMQLNKALYGCMQSSLLWYETFTKHLMKLGFTLNHYDPCVANRMINGHQCTIAWYVDDTMISHKDPKVVSWIINQIENIFGKMTVKRGAQHTFIGMDFELTKDKKVKITMKEYIKECIEAFGEEIKGSAKTPAKHNLFEHSQKEASTPLDDGKAEKFHHIVAKLLYVSKRARLDIDLPITYLCSKVMKPDHGDWEKLRRVLTYLNGTLDLPRIIGADNLDSLYSWVDASYATHADMRGHTGGLMSFGRGAVHHKCSKQKLNTKSSTESEIVGASDYIPWVIWLKHFLKQQGKELKTNTFFQDNESAIKLGKNGRKSSRDKTRHITIRYFFITDVLKRENIDMRHCPTTRMLADFYTKPLQGTLFVNMRNAIMGLCPMPIEERVENNVKKQNDVSKPNKDNSWNKIQNKQTYADIVRGKTIKQ